MTAILNLRRHLLDAADTLGLDLTHRDVARLANHLAVTLSRGPQQDDLTDCQFAALVGIAAGETAEETGRRIGRGFDTIKTHRLALYRALGAKTGAHAVTIAVDRNILRTPLGAIVARSGGEAA